MLKSGIMSVGGVIYDVYESATKKSYRLDIIIRGAQYQIEPHSVLFSVIKEKNKMYMYGDRELYNDYVKIKGRVTKHEADVKVTQGISGTLFRRIQEKGTLEHPIYQKVVHEKGVTVEEIYKYEADVISIKMEPTEYDIQQKPLNFTDYDEVSLAASTVVNDTTVTLKSLRFKYNLKHIDVRDYEIADEEEAEKLIQQIRDLKGTFTVIGYDYETTGLNMHNNGEDEMVGLVISLEKEHSRYLPFGHNLFENLPIEIYDRTVEAINEYVEWLNTQTIAEEAWHGVYEVDGEFKLAGVAAHNSKFEYKVLKKTGKKLEIKHDSLQIDIAYNPRIGRNIHGQKFLTEEIEGNQYIDFMDTLGKNSESSFADVPYEVVKYYACPDADGVRTILEDRFHNKDIKDVMYIYGIECKLAEVKAEQEYWGLRVKEDLYLELYTSVKATHAKLEKLIRSMTKWPDLNISSNDSLVELLYNRMKCPILSVTEAGTPSTKSAVLEQLATYKLDEPRDIITEHITTSEGKPIIKAKDLNEARYPIVLLLNAYRKYDKLVSAFFKRVEREAKGSIFGNNKTLVYYFWINANGTLTGRQSSPAHQFPGMIKKIMIPDSDVHGFVGTDYSQVELRIVFSYAGEKEFIEQSKDPDNDIHRIIGARLTHKEQWEISAKERSKGKRRNFGVVYKISGIGLARQNHGPRVTKEQVKEANDSIQELYNGYPGLLKFTLQNEQDVRRFKYARTKLGRYRYFDILNDPSAPKSKINSAIRQANNLPVQGTAAEIMKIAEVEANNIIKAKGWDKLVETPQGYFPLVRTVISAHDELLISYDKRHIAVEEILKLKRDSMEFTFEGWSPLFGSSSVIENWLEGKEDQYAIPIKLRDKLVEDYERTGISVCKTLNHKLEMLEIINEFRDNELNTYMQNIINEVGTDVDTVASKVRHATLTHDLIARYYAFQKEEEKVVGEMTHLESIRFATSKYLEGATTPEVIEQDTLTNENIEEEILNMAEATFDFDSDGNVIYNDAIEEVEEEENFWEPTGEKSVYTKEKKQLLVWQIVDKFIFQTNGMSPNSINELLAEIHKERDNKYGAYSVFLNVQNELIDTKMKVKHIDIHKYNDLIHKLKEE